MLEQAWKKGKKLGNVEFINGELMAVPCETFRSELVFDHDYSMNTAMTYWFSFKVSGQHGSSTNILQFHDWWNVPENIITKKKRLHMATPPPVALKVDKGMMHIEHNTLPDRHFYDYKNDFFVVPSYKLQMYPLCRIPLDAWVDLELEIFWATDPRGYIKWNGSLLAEKIVTAFNDNPCRIQCGLYGRTSLEKIVIREISYEPTKPGREPSLGLLSRR